ncbi:MgtC/SapB family protein [Clostridium gasigenes]|uniref:MgtC/SapB family protein n=1 Tax=Clostridium gasigenes TaxID=94869 RepID=A0A7X0SFK1_9CLOT|nr:MgtC/SapB family protein [Clostridium gasigenes]MBB6716691.1 MgtC/SapB family protein [Clostridium gasigenes]
MTTRDFVVRLLTACILGMLIGLERQYRQRKAGIHTNVLVSVGSCLFVMFSLIDGTGDRTRVAAQVVTGVGFLGGGVILREGLNVKGLNTAATLWCTASVGVLASGGYILFAIIGASMIIISNLILRPLGRKLYRLKQEDIEEELLYEIKIRCSENQESNVRKLIMTMIKDEKLFLRRLDSNDEEDGSVKVKVNVMGSRSDDVICERIVSTIGLNPEVYGIGWYVKEEEGE